MQAVVDGEKWRLRFKHLRVPITGKRTTRKGATLCAVERYVHTDISEGWHEVAYGDTRCGKLDAYCKEQGRQFSLVRALRGAEIAKQIKGALITAYIRSGSRDLCLDLRCKGYYNLYQVVFDKDGNKSL